ncbi:hypothetical protein AALO_G00195900 [Alosa alosa]|uniref:Uncharacterized protein n=1 Tax=Alosa alosa TaxID=278164 RepID=A0AAV6G819_9TELE|nr:hypothetical protein AALO_G00195900 [Alosa alosa]
MLSLPSPPVTPRLILLGERQGNHQKWMVSIESLIVCEGSNLATFLTGIMTCFSTFYILNLQYQEEAACTLEFFQRKRPRRSLRTITNK